MKRISTLALVLLGLLFFQQRAIAQSAIYSESFNGGQTYCPGSSNYDNWGTFRAGLDPLNVTYLSVRVYGSLDPIGKICTDVAIVSQIATALKNGTETTITCQGLDWRIGANCNTGCSVAGDDIELNAAGTGTDCSCGGDYTLRPCIGNANWGSIGVGGCNAPTQTMSVEFFAPLADDIGLTQILSPFVPYCNTPDSSFDVVVTNWGTDTLTTADLDWELNGVAQTQFNWTGSLGLGEHDTVHITSTLFTSGDNIHVWGSNPNGVADSNANNDSLMLDITPPALVGTYSIPLDYATITDAANDLIALGVCGPVVFELADGTYDEQVEFPEIMGASSTNTITFTSASQDPSLVTWTNSANNFSANYTIWLNGADHFRFNELTIENTSFTYARVIYYNNGSEDNWITDNIIRNDNVTTTSTNSVLVYSNNGLDHGTRIMRNEFWNGSYGLYLWGSGQTSLEEGTIVRGNTFRDQYYMFQYFYYQDGLETSWNDMESTSTYNFTSYGIWSYYCDNGLRIMNNTMRTINRMPMWGMRVYYSDNTNIERGLIANNCVRTGQAGNTGSSFYGLYMFQDGFLDVVNNTFSIVEGGTFSRALYSSGGGVNNVWNNNLVVMGNGYAMYLQDNYTMVESNNNNMYTMGNNYAYRGGQNYNNLANWQNGTGFDDASVSVDPNFVGNNCENCNDTIDGAANSNVLNTLGLTTDIAGTSRDLSSPDIGAVEFVGVGNFSLGGNQLVCGDTATLALGGNAISVLWSTGEISTNINVTNPGAYSVTAVTSCGTVSDTTEIDFAPPVELGGGQHLCADESGTLDANRPNSSYLWSTGDTTQTTDITAAGTYWVTVTKGNCVSSDDVVVTKSTAVELPVEESFCDGSSVTLDATIPDGVVYSWSPSAAGPSNTVTSTDIYSVTVTDAWGCVSSDTSDVKAVTQPTSSFVRTMNFLTASFTNTTPLTNGNDTYMWDFGDGSTSTLENPVHVYPWPGGGQTETWNVVFTVTNDCGFDQVSDQVTIGTTGIDDADAENNFVIYPNPNNGNFTVVINSADAKNTVVTVVDMHGRTVHTQDLGLVKGQRTENIQLEDIAKGVYFIRMDFDGVTTTSKLTIQ